MNCHVLGIAVMCLAAITSCIIGVGSTNLSKYRFFRHLFFYIGWPLVFIMLGVYFYTVQGMILSFQLSSVWIGILTFVVATACFLTETAMLSGLLMLVGGACHDGSRIIIKDGSPVDRLLQLRWGDSAYTRKDGSRQNVCSISWLVSINLALIPILLLGGLYFLIGQFLSLFFLGETISGKRLGYSPSVLLLISATLAASIGFAVIAIVPMAQCWTIVLFGTLVVAIFVPLCLKYQRARQIMYKEVKVPRAAQPAVRSIQNLISAAKDLKAGVCPAISPEEQ